MFFGPFELPAFLQQAVKWFGDVHVVRYPYVVEGACSQEMSDLCDGSVEYQCIMDIFTLSSLSAQVRAICVISIKGSCPK